LYVNYYFARWLLTEDFAVIAKGVDRSELLRRLAELHHDPDHLRDSDVGGFLNRLASLQASKGVKPPILDYEANDRLLKVVDSTFYFYLEHVDRASVVADLRAPDSLQRDDEAMAED
jgi:hypothetical protein